MSADVKAILVVARAFIMCFIEVGLRETLGGRLCAHRTVPSINRLC